MKNLEQTTKKPEIILNEELQKNTNLDNRSENSQKNIEDNSIFNNTNNNNDKSNENISNNQSNDYCFTLDLNLTNLNDIDKIKIVKLYSKYDIKTYGSQILLEYISKNIGLTNILQSVFPNSWKEILTLSFYMTLEDSSMLYCEEWVKKMDSLINSNKLTSQRISDLLKNISISEQIKFYELWALHRNELEYIALDVTSISSYSTQINDVAKGYNRDGEKLRQINLCMLFGEDSGLPIYSTSYSGSVTDVTAFCTIIDQFNFIKSNKDYKLVLDKGFFSIKNINKLLYNFNNKKFNISVPIKHNFIKQLISEYKNKFNANYAFYTGTDVLYGTTINYSWDKKNDLFLHIYFNEHHYNKSKEDILSTMMMLKHEAEQNPKIYRNSYEHKKYLIYTPKINDPNSFDISLKLDNIETLYKNKGWIFIISNDISDFKTALKIYRHKDVVEKAFDRLKNNLDLNRLRVKTNETKDGKLFIASLALILSSHIHKVMLDHDLYKFYTLKGLFNKLNNMKFIYLDNKVYINPLTKSEREILEAFNVPITSITHE
jgi:transposase